MQEINVKAPAKINLYLSVLGRRKDKFHRIETVMQAVSLFDEIKLRKSKDGIKFYSVHSRLPKGPGNLAYQAARLFLQKTRLKEGVSIELKKHIPVGAGLGGGSSDAGAVLCGLNRLWNLKISKKKLICWAKELGSDVPFFIEGRTARVSGRGETVKPLPVKKSFHFLLFFPGVSLSTARVYKALSKGKSALEFKGECRRDIERYKEDIRQLACALKDGDFNLMRECIYNSLEAVVFKIMPRLLIYRERLERAGLWSVKVCGSGSTLFAPVRNVREAEYIINTLELRRGVYIVRSLNV